MGENKVTLAHLKRVAAGCGIARRENGYDLRQISLPIPLDPYLNRHVGYRGAFGDRENLPGKNRF